MEIEVFKFVKIEVFFFKLFLYFLSVLGGENMLRLIFIFKLVLLVKVVNNFNRI